MCTVEALLTDGLISRRLYLLPTLQNPFLSTAIQTMYFYTSVSSQLQLRTHFSSPDSVHLLELPLEFGLCNVFSPIEEVEAVSSITLLYLMQNTIIHIQDTQWRCCFASLVAVGIRLHLNNQTLEGNVSIHLKHVKTVLFLFPSDNIMKTTKILRGIYHHQVTMESYVK